jgi:hypothetical protein
MKTIAIFSVLLLVLAGCTTTTKQTFCQDLQPEVNAYFGEGFTIRNSATGAALVSAVELIGGSDIEYCAYQSGGHVIEIAYEKGDRIANMDVVDMENESLEIHGNYTSNTSIEVGRNNIYFIKEAKFVEGDEFVYYYTSRETRSKTQATSRSTYPASEDLFPHYETTSRTDTLDIWRGPTKVSLTVATLGDADSYGEDRMKGFAMLVGEK